MSAGDTLPAPAPDRLQASDVVAFGQEVGRVLSDGRIVGRAEPYAKVFPSSRAVKRAVGLMAWAVLEDIALDARVDERGRLVADTTVRRIAANLGLNKDTVTKYLGRLREHGFVFQEEAREVTSGRWEPCRYVLDPAACIGRFTQTPPAAHAETPRSQPCPNPSDTVPAPVSETTGHGDTGQGGVGRNVRDVDVVKEQQHVGAGTRTTAAIGAGELRGRLVGLGVTERVADDLVSRYPLDRVRDAVDAAELRPPRRTAGWIVTALRDGWDLSGMLVERRRAAEARCERKAEEAGNRAAAAGAERQRPDRAVGWSAAISAALSDEQLAAAIGRVSTPVPGLGRHSVPVARAQLITWAVGVQSRAPGLPLPDALEASPRNGAAPSPVCDDRDLPEPPATGHPPDLSARIATHLQRGGEWESAGRTPARTPPDPDDGGEL
jgi:hypothetical protein